MRITPLSRIVSPNKRVLCSRDIRVKLVFNIQIIMEGKLSTKKMILKLINPIKVFVDEQVDSRASIAGFTAASNFEAQKNLKQSRVAQS